MKVNTKTEYIVTLTRPVEFDGETMPVGTTLGSHETPFPWHGGMGSVEKGATVIMVVTGYGDRAPFDITGHTVEVVDFSRPVPEWTETNRTPWTAP